MKEVYIPCTFKIEFDVEQEVPEEALTSVEAFKEYIEENLEFPCMEEVLDRMWRNEEFEPNISHIKTKEDLDRFIEEN